MQIQNPSLHTATLLAPLKNQAPAPTAQALKPQGLPSDGLQLDVQRAKNTTLSLVGGTAAGVLAATGSAALLSALIKVPSEGILTTAGVAGVGLGISAGLTGVVSSRFLTSDPKTGALIGAVTGAAAGGALPHAFFGMNLGGTATLLGATVGAAAGAAGGWAAARIAQ